MGEDLISLARDNVEAFNDADWERMRSTLSANSIYEEPGTQRRFEGPDAIIEANQGWRAAFADATGTVTDAFACGDRVAVRITWEGTQSGALQVPGGEIPPTGRKITVQACQVMRVEDGKIVDACHFFDMLGMLEQIGTISSETLAHTG